MSALPSPAALAAVLALALAAGPAAAQAGDSSAPSGTGAAPARFGDWALHCGDSVTEGRICRLSQTIRAHEGDRWLANIAVIDNSADADVMQLMLVQVPAGVHFPSGIFITFPGAKPRAMVWQKCTPSVCEAAMRLSPAERRSFAGGSSMDVTYRPALGVPPIRVGASLRGSRDGLAALAAGIGDSSGGGRSGWQDDRR